jgi:hypothetical protein
MKTSEVLEKALELISQPGARCKGSWALTADGVTVRGDEPDAVCFCPLGAVAHVLGDHGSEQWHRAKAFLNRGAHRVAGTGVIDVNDYGTKGDLEATFHAAITLARQMGD